MKRIVVFTLALSIACASLPVKQKAVVTLQSSEAALEASHDLERGLCSPAADKTAAITHCDGPVAVQVGLTDAKHQQIAKLYVQAFDVQIKAATAVKLWRAGDPAPTDFLGYQKVISDILAAVAAVIPKTEPTVVKVQEAVTEAAKVAALLSGVKS